MRRASRILGKGSQLICTAVGVAVLTGVLYAYTTRTSFSFNVNFKPKNNGS